MLASLYLIEEYTMTISRRSGPSVDARALHPAGVKDSAEMMIKSMMNNFFTVMSFDVLLARFILIVSVYRLYLNSIDANAHRDSVLSSGKIHRLVTGSLANRHGWVYDYKIGFLL